MNVDLEREVIYKGKKLSFNEFLQKVEGKSKGWVEFLSDGKWQLLADLWKKFSSDGRILDFFGDTVVIPVKDRYKDKAFEIQELLYDDIGELLAERLVKDSFHITIHDLDNELGEWSSLDELKEKIEENRKRCEVIFKDLSEYLRRKPDYSKIYLKGVGILGGFVAVSIAFVPNDEKSFRILLNLYNLFEEIVPLEKEFYPHLTLGYYKAKDFSKDEMKRIKECTVRLNEVIEGMQIELDLWDLSYQVFKDMNNYETILKLGNFIR